MAVNKKRTKKDKDAKIRSAAKHASTPTVRSKNGDKDKPATKSAKKPAEKPSGKAIASRPAKKDNITKASTRTLGLSDIERLRQAELLLDLSRRIGAMESLDEILATMVEMTTWELGAERGTLFLNDPITGELYSRFAQGSFLREIRILNNTGIAGWVFSEAEGVIIHDAYHDERFNRSIDEQTGYITRGVLCVPVRTIKGDVIGVCQVLNKKKGRFTQADLRLLERMTEQASVALQSTQYVERMQKTREQEMEFLDIVSDVTSELELGSLLQKVMAEATRMLQADRGTLFINDEKTNELYSRVAMGESIGEIRLPNHLGIAGAVFTSGKTVNIPYCYADLRFNPAFDKQTGYFTRSMLCVPVLNKEGKVIGVTQVLNKRGGPFDEEDETRLKAFTAQVSIGLENAKLFDDVQNIKNYNESMLESMSNGVVTLDEDAKIVTCNAAGSEILKVAQAEIIGQSAEAYFSEKNDWILEKVTRVAESGETDSTLDAELVVGDEKLSVNVSVMPLVSTEDKSLGTMIMFEDISSEKRMKSTMSRYMDPGIADQLMEGGEDILGGTNVEATILFSDVRGFTTLTEELGAQGTVSLLNDYFTIMVDCITREEGMLDKFIGDAIMAAFGLPISHDDDEDRAVRAAISMIVDMWAWNEVRAEKGQKPVDMGIGLNTGNVVSGNIGSPKRMDYTMIGDGVNLGARLESACKQYSARILISENTYEKLRGTYRIRDIDDVIVKGKTKPVRVYEVLDYHTEETCPNLMDVVNYFTEARKQYHEGNWDKAVTAFKEVLKANPADKLSETYIERCQHLKKLKPKDWNGVWVMTSK
ncbi:MAG: GAF domain-containing protein [Alphaproteobacteria bacterium]|jgi:adenylate cyclase|nr:GAF domain-containing protein [Alphaproteobacteria bacterium]MBT4545766.1 GAF domain-containing protein [Alphaproteobacteria bacterium]MBT7744859.1 GAF domain-containing protein [Alphaproteobacteria bacterium]